MSDLKLTKPQQEFAEWALCGVQSSGRDNAETLSRDADMSMEDAEKISPYISGVKVENGALVLPPDATPEFVDWLATDLEYRLTEQLPDMEDGAYEQGLSKGQSIHGAMGGAKAMIRCALATWEKIKKQIGGEVDE